MAKRTDPLAEIAAKCRPKQGRNAVQRRHALSPYALPDDLDELTAEEMRFGQAMDRYKRRYHRPFPTWREVLAVLKSLGYLPPAETTVYPRLHEQSR